MHFNKSNFLFFIFLIGQLTCQDISIAKIADEAVVAYVHQELEKSLGKIEQLPQISILQEKNLQAWALSRTNHLFLGLPYETLIYGILERQSCIEIILDAYTLRIPRECAVLIVRNMLLHEMGHLVHKHYGVSTVDGEIIADEYSACEFESIMGGIIMYRLENIRWQAGQKGDMQRGHFIYMAHYGDNRTHPSPYEREEFFRKKLEEYITKDSSYQIEYERLIEYANQIEIEIASHSSGIIHVTNIFKHDMFAYIKSFFVA